MSVHRDATPRRVHTGDLARGAVGLPGVVFQSVTEMGPAVAIASSIPFAIGFAGGAAILSVLLAMLGALLVANSIGQLSKHLPSAGSFYTYSANGLHPWVGYVVGWAFALAQFMVNPLLYAFIGLTVAGTFNAEWGWSTGQWWIWSVLCALIVAAVGYRGVKVSARVGVALGVIEIAVFAVLALWLIAKAGGDNTLKVFTLDYADTEGYKGLSGVFAGSVFTVLAFIGFESAAVLAEEAEDAVHIVKRAVVGSVVVVGSLYLLTTYAATVFFGADRMDKFVEFGGGNPWDGVSRDVWNVGWVIVFLAIVNSIVANANASSNATTRTWFSLGRIRLFPTPLAHVQPSYRSPDVALGVQLVLGIAVTLWLGYQYDPLSTVLLSGTVITIVFIPMYMILNVACFAYYLRFRRSEFNWVRHALLPLIGTVAFIPAFFSAAGIPAFKFISSLPAPLSYAAPAVLIWLGLGIVYGIYLARRHPERITQTALVFGDDESAAGEGDAAPAPAMA
jgi:amino acid transporter